MTLPTTKTRPSEKLFDYTIYLFGVPKIGKSTLVAEIEDVLFLNTGGGLDAISCYQAKINTWQEFLNTGAEFIAGGHSFKALAIDTIERLHKLCLNYVIEKWNANEKNKTKIMHPQDLEFGKAYDMVKDEFIRPLTKLALSPYGLIMLGHVREVEVTSRTRKYNKSIPTLQDYVWQLIDGLTDIIMFYAVADKDGKPQRMIRTEPSEEYIAGDRTNRLRSFGDIIMSPDGNNWKKIEDAFNRSIKEETK